MDFIVEKEWLCDVIRPAMEQNYGLPLCGPGVDITYIQKSGIDLFQRTERGDCWLRSLYRR